MDWKGWLVGIVILVAAGFLLEYQRRRRPARTSRAEAESLAAAAISAAQISKDAAPQPDEEAAELLRRAELLLADSTGPQAARTATELARQADQRWRQQR